LNQYCRGSDAISVKVTIDGDFLTGKQSLISSAYCLMYVREKKGVGFQSVVGVEEKLNLGKFGDSSIAKQLS